MGRLVYTSIGSLDGFTADADGAFDWSMPSEQVHAFLNARDRASTLELYGRRLYQVMKVWQSFGTGPDASAVERDYGEQWRRRDKVVFSSTLDAVETERTRLVRRFDPEQVRQLVHDAEGDVTIGGPTLAAHALRAGLVDRIEYYLNPVAVGGGLAWLPPDLRLGLRLLEQQRFDNGVIFVSYGVERASA